MARRFLQTLLVGTFVFVLSSPSWALKVSAKKDGVKVHAEASKKSSVVATLSKGESIDAIERKGLYWQVKTSAGEEGYVSVLRVKRQSGGESGIAQAIRAASEDGRANGDEVENTRSRSAVMGVRGLDESQETQYAGNTKPNLRLVYQMEDRRVSTKKISELERLIQKELVLLTEKN